jgi:hypothetical protein
MQVTWVLTPGGSATEAPDAARGCVARSQVSGCTSQAADPGRGHLKSGRSRASITGRGSAAPEAMVFCRETREA